VSPSPKKPQQRTFGIALFFHFLPNFIVGPFRDWRNDPTEYFSTRQRCTLLGCTQTDVIIGWY
jgi:hypothetical protein